MVHLPSSYRPSKFSIDSLHPSLCNVYIPDSPGLALARMVVVLVLFCVIQLLVGNLVAWVLRSCFSTLLPINRNLLTHLDQLLVWTMVIVLNLQVWTDCITYSVFLYYLTTLYCNNL